MLCLPLIITCVFVQHVVEPVYILHYDRHVYAVSTAFYFGWKFKAKSGLLPTLRRLPLLLKRKKEIFIGTIQWFL